MDRIPDPSPRVRFLGRKWADRLGRRAGQDHSLAEGAEPLSFLLASDPTGNKEYLDWLCRTYCAGAFLAEDEERVRNTLTLFHRWKRRLPPDKRDIGRYRSEQSVWEAVAPFDPARAEDHEPEGREKRRLQRAKALAESEVLDDDGLDGWIVASPMTHFAARWWGRGTRWCTSMNTERHFATYSSRGRLWVFVDPEGNKFQAHVATGSCADASDRDVDFAGFVDRLPEAALAVLREDAVRRLSAVGPRSEGPVELSTLDLYRVIVSIPRAIVPDEIAAAFVKHGLGKVIVRAEEDGWRLLLVTDQLAKWAMDLPFSSWSMTSFLVLEEPGAERIHADCDDSYAQNQAFAEIAMALGRAPAGFRSAAAMEVAALWEGRNGYRAAAPLSAFIASLPFPLPQEAWVAIARKIIKKPRDWHDMAVPHEHVDDEVADILAKGWSLSALPPAMVTKERIMAFAAAHPDLAEGEIEACAGFSLDRDVAMAMASSRNGDGLRFVPQEFKDRDFCLEVLSRVPRALKHVPEEFLSHSVCCSVMDRNGLLLDDVPERFLDEEICLRAVTRNGGMLAKVPPKFKTEAVCRAALDSCPDQFVNVGLPLCYSDFLRGVSLSGTLLARVPLAFRDAQMCRAALSKQRDAVAHVPPSVRAEIAACDPHLVSANARLSSRYPKSDPIHAFVPSGDMPEALPPLRPLEDGSWSMAELPAVHDEVRAPDM